MQGSVGDVSSNLAPARRDTSEVTVDWHSALFGDDQPAEVIGGKKRGRRKAKAARKARRRNRR